MRETFMDRVRVLQTELRTRTCLESPEPLGAFVIGGHAVGRLTTKVMAVMRQDPILTQWIDAGDSQTFTLLAEPHFEALNLALDQVTLRLEALGLTQRRRPEKLDIFNDEGQVLAQAERSVFRTLGLTTHVVRLLALTPHGHFWLQRRSPNKPIGAGLWDNLAAGMMAASETPQTAMLRELHEEAGLNVGADTLVPLPTLSFDYQCPVPEGWMQERTASYLLTVPSEITPTNLDGEADAFASFSPRQAVDLIEADRLMPEAARLLLEWIVAR